MEVAMPMTGSAIDCYEDMFKEITRKLYGEDGLPELSANERLASTSTDRGLTPIEYEVENPILKPEEHLTAFGLAALMQNGFPPSGILNPNFQCHKPNNGTILNTNCEDKWISSEDNLQWTQSKIATYNPAQKLYKCSECDCVGYLLRVAEHWLGTHSSVRAFHCPQCPYESAWARCVRIHLNRQHNINTDESCDTLTKDNPVIQEIVKYLQKLKNKLDSNCNKVPASSTVQSEDYHNQSINNTSTISNNSQVLGNSSSASPEQTSTSTKRYSCTFCPYATDRRDLFTRHENIHREEKPFQCYVCQKQFNRADHVKKHFLRMHRDHPYDLNRIRRHPPKNASGMSYYQKYNSNITNQTNDLSTISSLSIPGFNNMSRAPQMNTRVPQSDIKTNVKTGNISRSNGKKKGEKRFTCCYCSWSGVDNWCLKRHMNTHLKPFVCSLCDYKAARSERLATHVLKVHNKRACSKCQFLADDLTQLSVHQQEQHPLEQRSRTNNSNILRANTFNGSTSTSTSNSITNSNPGPCSSVQSQGLLKTHDLSTAAAMLQQSNRFLQTDAKTWKHHIPKQHGAARLFSYMEASDGSEPESEPRVAEDMSRMNLTHRIQSDFPEAGDVGNQADEENGEEMELPLFVCQTCGCEFEDDLSLESHQYTHRHSAASPAKTEHSKENVNPDLKYHCRLCDAAYEHQSSIIEHMTIHSTLSADTLGPPVVPNHRSRKQNRPKKLVLPFWDPDEIDVLRHLSAKLRRWKETLSTSTFGVNRLVDKYMAKLVTRSGRVCIWCKNTGLSRYHTKATLALHHYWRHTRKKFKCEHCDMAFKHRYQSVLHSSRVHTNQKSQLVPMVLPKEPTHSALSAESLCSSQDTSLFFSNPHTVYVPDATMSNAHKLGMSFFDHSFIHPSNAINNHMPIIIPTFPPN
ncbi:zinc finger protein Xfin isoform X1 [Diorhabda sublineata]|uniref:zinc finger protein Xfin isoform X1 n=1 Tax=Diorhabda sublineata TaxID=1163346 RepID=UPI0024E142BD|nr:zinc finger protein Xfin isoform X1 [Diorhabda sublineata]